MEWSPRGDNRVVVPLLFVLCAFGIITALMVVVMRQRWKH
jgi:hypothetical protein